MVPIGCVLCLSENPAFKGKGVEAAMHVKSLLFHLLS